MPSVRSRTSEYGRLPTAQFGRARRKPDLDVRYVGRAAFQSRSFGWQRREPVRAVVTEMPHSTPTKRTSKMRPSRWWIANVPSRPVVIHSSKPITNTSATGLPSGPSTLPLIVRSPPHSASRSPGSRISMPVTSASPMDTRVVFARNPMSPLRPWYPSHRQSVALPPWTEMTAESDAPSGMPTSKVPSAAVSPQFHTASPHTEIRIPSRETPPGPRTVPWTLGPPRAPSDAGSPSMNGDRSRSFLVLDDQIRVRVDLVAVGHQRRGNRCRTSEVPRRTRAGVGGSRVAWPTSCPVPPIQRPRGGGTSTGPPVQ